MARRLRSLRRSRYSLCEFGNWLIQPFLAFGGPGMVSEPLEFHSTFVEVVGSLFGLTRKLEHRRQLHLSFGDPASVGNRLPVLQRSPECRIGPLQVSLIAPDQGQPRLDIYVQVVFLAALKNRKSGLKPLRSLVESLLAVRDRSQSSHRHRDTRGIFARPIFIQTCLKLCPSLRDVSKFQIHVAQRFVQRGLRPVMIKRSANGECLFVRLPRGPKVTGHGGKISGHPKRFGEAGCILVLSSQLNRFVGKGPGRNEVGSMKSQLGRGDLPVEIPSPINDAFTANGICHDGNCGDRHKRCNGNPSDAASGRAYPRLVQGLYGGRFAVSRLAGLATVILPLQPNPSECMGQRWPVDALTFEDSLGRYKAEAKDASLLLPRELARFLQGLPSLLDRKLELGLGFRFQSNCTPSRLSFHHSFCLRAREAPTILILSELRLVRETSLD